MSPVFHLARNTAGPSELLSLLWPRTPDGAALSPLFRCVCRVLGGRGDSWTRSVGEVEEGEKKQGRRGISFPFCCHFKDGFWRHQAPWPAVIINY